MAKASKSADSTVLYHFLDMGEQQYGECILVTSGDTKVLIDGGHPGDYKDRVAQSIPNQLATLIDGPPFALDLLVVTHCHSDHIGCLPTLVAQGTITAKRVLAVDPDLGFAAGASNAPTDGLDEALEVAQPSSLRLLAALSEEDHSDLDDGALADFIDAAVRQPDAYRAMLATLAKQGSKVTLFTGLDTTAGLGALERAVASVGMKVLGPTNEQLTICNTQIRKFAKDTLDMSDQLMDAAAGLDEVARYRQLIGQRSSVDGFPVLTDQFGAGSAINCQSIVLAFGPEDERVLLGADMQFTKSEVTGLDAVMSDFRKAVAGNYKLVKMTHHTSYNGTTSDFLDSLGSPSLLVHSGGSNDVKHPDAATLQGLEELNSKRKLHFVRTDRNGLIVADPSQTPARVFKCAVKGEDDFTPNARDATAMPAMTPSSAASAAVPPSAPQQYADVIIIRVPLTDGRIRIDGHTIEVGRAAAEAGPTPVTPASRVAGTLLSEGEERAAPEDVVRKPPRLAGGRQLPKLLFLTDSRKLAHNIGSSEATQALTLIRDAKQVVLDVDTNASSAAVEVSAALKSGQGFKGVVIVGGYDVIPSQRIDVLDAALRQQVLAEGHGGDDPDNFVVWNDDVYGDSTGDGMADVPVSRIPDARTAALVLAALSGAPSNPQGRFGIRNSARPFAAPIFAMLPGNQALYECGPTEYSTYKPVDAATSLHYFMLHGSAQDSTRYWGDTANGPKVALTTEQVRRGGVDTAFAGCCWGALSVQQQAKDGGGLLAAKTPLSSIALTTLLGGARAYVGCTGAHYSPDSTGSFFGGPMHRAFWTRFKAGQGPSEALFNAKKDFLAGMPHGMTQPFEVGIEKKLYKMFTCLGLGW